MAAAAALGVFFASLVIVAFPLLLKPLAAEFGWSRESVSVAFAIAAAAAALGAVPCGYLVDRVGPRAVAGPSLALFGCGFASLALLTPHRWHLYLVFGALGLAGIGTSPVTYGRAIGTWFTERRGLALALVVSGGALGGVLHPPLTEALIRRVGWRGACAALGALTLLLGLPAVLRFVREQQAGASPERDQARTFGVGVRSRVFWTLAAVQCCAVMLQNAVIVHLAALLTDRGVSTARAAAALSLMAVAAVLGRLVTGSLIDRVFAARVLVALLACAAVGAALLADSRSFAIGAMGAVLVGFGTGGESDIVPYLLSRYFGLRFFSSLYGLAWMIGAVGGALGPVLMGREHDATGSYRLMLLRLALVGVAAAGLALVLPRYEMPAVPARAASS